MDKLPNEIRLVVLDFDGVLTDDRVYVFEDGREAVVCSRSDGFGVQLLRRAGLEVLILSGETNPVVTARGGKLGVAVCQGVDDKAEVLCGLITERSLTPEQVAYVGNDVNDVECLRLAGLGAVPADAHPAAVEAADLVLSRLGGRGAVRELADLLLAALLKPVEAEAFA